MILLLSTPAGRTNEAIYRTMSLKKFLTSNYEIHSDRHRTKTVDVREHDDDGVCHIMTTNKMHQPIDLL
jgi:hypothetical protein